MTINLENGKYYELNNGAVKQCKYYSGCYMLGQGYYSKTGIHNHYAADHPLSVKREVETGTLASDTPTLFRDMTDAEKGALLLAEFNGEVIQTYNVVEWFDITGECHFCDDAAHRVKPKPVVENVTLYGSAELQWAFATEELGHDTHSLTLTITDGDITDVKAEGIK